MDNTVVTLLSIFLIIILILYKYLTKNNGYWKSRGIPEANGAIPIFGNMKDIVFMKKNIGDFIEKIYKENKNNSMVGIYEFQKPVIIVNNIELIKTVLQSSFNNFSEHQNLDPKVDPLLVNDPFFLNHQEWKDTRSIFTNAYSIKKLKDLLPLVNDVSKKFIDYMNKKIKSSNDNSIDIEVKQLFSKYTAATSASTILGIDAQTFVDKDSPNSLRSMMDAMFVPRSFEFRQLIGFYFPKLGSLINVGFVPDWINKSFQNIVDDILSQDDKTLKNNILYLIKNQLEEKNKFNDITIAGIAFGFFVEVYESSSMTLSIMSYYLAKNKAIQEKARKEINDIFKKHGELTYDALNDMTYIEQIIKESLRCISPVGRLLKICSEPITLKGPDGLTCKLNKGDEVIIPVFGLHKDPQYWDNPDEFIPERFDQKNYDKERNRYAFLPFGEGPRMCPGMKFGIMQIKVVIATILMNYVMEPSKKMKEPFELDPRSFLTTIKNGYWIKMQRRSLL
ncbi:cytochrome P450 6j1-like [Aphidius gifuensis]|uniref:cytochrome P450 6j1-like n=1 Tax=Aphidius gifuensis TaxID=684658 RepID=UPI001CDBA24B|nr:cytochrome P450 6j1-like [Aphidius gifuensis]